MGHGILDCGQARLGFLLPFCLGVLARSHQFLQFLVEIRHLLVVGRLVLFVFFEGVSGECVIGFVTVIVEGEESVVLVLGDVVVLVVVTAGAGQGESEPHGAGGLEAIHYCGHTPLLLVGAALGVGQGLPMKCSGEALFRGSLGQ